MRASRVLRACIILNLVSTLVYAVLSVFLEAYLPEPLFNWLIATSEATQPGIDNRLFMAGLFLLLLWWISAVALFFLRRWGAWLYVTTVILGLFLQLFMGPTVEHAFAIIPNYISALLDGMILSLSFFSSALNR